MYLLQVQAIGSVTGLHFKVTQTYVFGLGTELQKWGTLALQMNAPTAACAVHSAANYVFSVRGSYSDKQRMAPSEVNVSDFRLLA